jgi:anti-sigma B factor antagonist
VSFFFSKVWRGAAMWARRPRACATSGAPRRRGRYRGLSMNERLAPMTMTDVAGGLRVAGEIDASTVGELVARLTPLPGEAEDIILELSGVQFIDSSGLRALIEVHRQASDAGRRLVLNDPSAIVNRLLDISGLTSYLHICRGGKPVDSAL